ncbi:MAG: Eco57I restriction-modification methylase domain-containing protein [Planctomycetaceae bacterium]|jgi:site-specific DNA-methyltransferase (adenine-specific)|nr:Eco57I restriction-modification methylase domain-containing protein [Planctomycetaceae bacterium]
MKFDVIIGNPPYQLNDGGGMGTSAKPLYDQFVQQAKKMNPRFLTMIIPARWFSGGKGLDEFRNNMLKDNRITRLVDYFVSNDCFSGVDISGGVCYFLWERDCQGECEIISIREGKQSIMRRPLLEKTANSFIRFNEAISIVRKIMEFNETSFETIVSVRRPFGIDAKVKIQKKPFQDSIKFYSYPENGYISMSEIKRNVQWIDKPKVFITKAYGERGNFPYFVLGRPFIDKETSCCSETYLVVGTFDSDEKNKNVSQYLTTKFLRFLVLLKKNTQNAPKNVYSFVPMQDFSESWTDKKLYKKYGLTADEIAFIENMIRPMDLTTNEDNNK